MGLSAQLTKHYYSKSPICLFPPPLSTFFFTFSLKHQHPVSSSVQHFALLTSGTNRGRHARKRRYVGARNPIEECGEGRFRREREEEGSLHRAGTGSRRVRASYGYAHPFLKSLFRPPSQKNPSYASFLPSHCCLTAYLSQPLRFQLRDVSVFLAYPHIP